MSIAELSQIWKPLTHRQWIRKRQRKEKFRRQLLNNPTPAEIEAWNLIREIINFKHLGYFFRRQQGEFGYILDFYCHHLKLGIEIDGSIHQKTEYSDKYRDDNLQLHGIKIIRFTNDEIFNKPNYVKDSIWKACTERIAEFRALK